MTYIFFVASFSGVGALISVFSLFLYEQHLVTCPVTGRKKFVALTVEQTEKIAKWEFNNVSENSRSSV